MQPLLPVFLSYVLSFVYVGIYWNNHHHMLHADAARDRRGAVGQPASAVLAVAGSVRHGWMGENHFAAAPTALYGVVLLMAAIAYWILQQVIIASEGPDSLLSRAVGPRLEGQAVAGALRDRDPAGVLVAGGSRRRSTRSSR